MPFLVGALKGARPSVVTLFVALVMRLAGGPLAFSAVITKPILPTYSGHKKLGCCGMNGMAMDTFFLPTTINHHILLCRHTPAQRTIFARFPLIFVGTVALSV